MANPSTGKTVGKNQEPKPISLVLSSGGARGLAHIGVIRELKARNYKIEAVAGCSMGALIGGLHAVDAMESYAEWVTGLGRTDVLKLVDLTNRPGGFISGDKLMVKIKRWIAGRLIEELPIKYTAVAVDIERECEVWLNSGSLYDAIRASIAIPGVFTPYVYKGRTLVDGSLLNPIPVEPTTSQLSDKTFVIDANGPEIDLTSFSGSSKKDRDQDAKKGVLIQFMDKIGIASKVEKPEAKKHDVLGIMSKSLDIMQGALTRQHLAIFQPDHVFHIPKNICMIYEFYHASKLIDLGQKLARIQLDEIENKGS